MEIEDLKKQTKQNNETVTSAKISESVRESVSMKKLCRYGK